MIIENQLQIEKGNANYEKEVEPRPNVKSSFDVMLNYQFF